MQNGNKYTVPKNGIIEIFIDQSGTNDCNIQLNIDKVSAKIYYANATSNYRVFTDSFIVNKNSEIEVAKYQNGFRNFRIYFIPFKEI